MKKLILLILALLVMPTVHYATVTNVLVVASETSNNDSIKILEKGLHDFDENLLVSLIPIFKTALERSPADNLPPYYLGLIYEGLMDIYEGKGSMKKAVEYAKKGVFILEESVRIKSDFAGSHRALAAVAGWLASTGAYNGMKYGSKADRATELAQKFDPDNPKVLILAAEKYLLAPTLFGGDRQKAVEILEGLTSEHPDYSDAWLRLGMAYQAIGKYESAITSLEKVLEINPKNIQASRLLREY